VALKEYYDIVREMKDFNLNIAGYKIRFESTPDGPELAPSGRFSRYLVSANEHEILIKVHSGIYTLPEEAVRVFHAPYVEEINGILLHQKTNFWSIWTASNDLFIKTIFPLTEEEQSAVLKFSLTTKEWDLWIDGSDGPTDPFEYPLDGLVLYYLTVIHGDILIHSSGVKLHGTGYLFSGVSGRGKSTMAMLWDNYGAKVIHDDRLILRKTPEGYRMYNTPVYSNEEPLESPLNRVFIIEHGVENELSLIKGAAAVSLIMANCIQHNWGSEIITRLLGSVSELCSIIPVSRLHFRPDSSVIDYILKNEQVPE
jgi:hypothetical protein